MKKKLITLLTLVCVLCCALWLVACNNGNVKVRYITLDETRITITQGHTATLTATVKPSNATDQKLEWSSSNQSVAIVEDGYIAAIGEGTTTITAKSSNGKTATCAVTVEVDPDNPYVMQFDVKFDPNGGKFSDGSTEPIEKTVNWGDKLNPVTVTRDSKYKFAGWYIKGQPHTGAWDFEAYGVHNDITLYAKWDYSNNYEIVELLFANAVKKSYEADGKENVDVDIISVYSNDECHLCFIENDRYGVTAYETNLPSDSDDIITLDMIKEFLDNPTITEIDSYSYYYNSDNYSYIVDYLPGKYIDGECSVIYACVTDWVYDANDHLSTTGPWYSCKVKALMASENGNVFTYSATIVAGATNFNLVLSGTVMSEEFDEVITPLGDFANDYYSEYLKEKEADIYY